MPLNGIGGQAATAAPNRSPLVVMALNDVGQVVNELSVAVGSLETRLGPVLAVTPGQPPGAGANKGPRAALPALAEELHLLRDRLLAVTASLRELYDRVEV